MFPIDSNDAYRNSNGSLTTIEEKISSGGGSDIPTHSISDAGKVLTVGEDGELEWNEKGEGGGLLFELAEASNVSGVSYSYDETYEVTETGSYDIKALSYGMMDVYINDVKQSYTVYSTTYYVYAYFEIKQLSIGDRVRFYCHDNGAHAFSITIQKAA